MTLGDMLDSVSERFPQKEAIVSGEQRITYGELRRQVARMARAFVALGVRKGDKVSIWLHNCPEWIMIQLALGKIGAILVPINTRFRVRELEYTLGQSDSRILVTMDTS